MSFSSIMSEGTHQDVLDHREAILSHEFGTKFLSLDRLLYSRMLLGEI